MFWLLLSIVYAGDLTASGHPLGLRYQHHTRFFHVGEKGSSIPSFRHDVSSIYNLWWYDYPDWYSPTREYDRPDKGPTLVSSDTRNLEKNEDKIQWNGSGCSGNDRDTTGRARRDTFTWKQTHRELNPILMKRDYGINAAPFHVSTDRRAIRNAGPLASMTLNRELNDIPGMRLWRPSAARNLGLDFQMQGEPYTSRTKEHLVFGKELSLFDQRKSDPLSLNDLASDSLEATVEGLNSIPAIDPWLDQRGVSIFRGFGSEFFWPTRHFFKDGVDPQHDNDYLRGQSRQVYRRWDVDAKDWRLNHGEVSHRVGREEFCMKVISHLGWNHFGPFVGWWLHEQAGPILGHHKDDTLFEEGFTWRSGSYVSDFSPLGTNEDYLDLKSPLSSHSQQYDEDESPNEQQRRNVPLITRTAARELYSWVSEAPGKEPTNSEVGYKKKSGLRDAFIHYCAPNVNLNQRRTRQRAAPENVDDPFGGGSGRSDIVSIKAVGNKLYDGMEEEGLVSEQRDLYPITRISWSGMGLRPNTSLNNPVFNLRRDMQCSRRSIL